MKLLMIYCDYFSTNPNIKTLDSAEEVKEKLEFENALVGMIHVEAEDEENAKKVETKLVKNLKWAARKNETNKIVLHSFAHLSDSDSSPEFAQGLFDNAEKRLKEADYETFQTPFGYFNDLEIKAPGYSQARMFKGF
ncbi:MAG: hypothetical protein GF307_11690 [candidate division Zixibacteria bacterium]|nr:hypothetical protein [candidate division Zixibacteria bacterium]